MGPVAARAERLVHARVRRERGRARSCTWRCRRRARSRWCRHEPARATRHADSTRWRFRWRSYVLLGRARLCARVLPRVARRRPAAGGPHFPGRRKATPRFSRVVADRRAPRHHHGSLRRAAGRQHAGRFGLGESAGAGARARTRFRALAEALKQDRASLTRLITSNLDREFLYLARHRQPAEAQKIKALGIPGVYLIARVPPLLPGGRSGRPRPRLHQRRRRRPGRPRARVRSLARRRGRRASASSRTATAGSCRTSRASARRGRAATSCCRSTCASSTSPIAS